jgi:CheY-like chemotaxis protein
MTKILFVDDNEFNRDVMQCMIELLHEDSQLKLCKSAFEVLSLDTDEYDLILSDIDMPGMDGYELYEKLRNEKKYKNPIIAVTALAVVGDRDKILLHGFNDYVSKPIEILELEKSLKKYI